MSDEEEVYSEEEEEPTPTVKKTESRPSLRGDKEEGDGDPEFIKKQEQKNKELDEQLKEYISDWRKQRAREEEELKRLKEKQAKRKVMRADEEKRLAERKKQEEENRIREAEERKQRDIEEKRRRLEEAEKKRQALMQAMQGHHKSKGPNFTVSKKGDQAFNMTSAQLERNKTKEQLEEEKKISLSIRIKPLDIDNLSIEKLKAKATELWECIVKLETEKYDLEERQKRQEYDLKELKERQKQQLRHKALKKGLDPEALTGKYPPKIQVASKYERRVDTRSYDDKKKLFEGGLIDLTKEALEKQWQEKGDQFGSRQKSKLPKWFGERPGKKKGDPESPEEEEVKATGVDDDEPEEPRYEPEPEEEEEEEEVEEVEEEEEEEEEEE